MRVYLKRGAAVTKLLRLGESGIVGFCGVNCAPSLLFQEMVFVVL
jgi:hypothetical protein